MLTVRRLAAELLGAGWPDNRRLVVLAARYYLGLETVETMRQAGLPQNLVEYIQDMR